MKSLRTCLACQTKELEALEDKTPTPARCREALLIIMASYEDSCKEKTDAAEAGAAQAVARAKQRAEQLDAIANTVERLREEAEQAVTTRTCEHDRRAADWKALNSEVAELLKKRLTKQKSRTEKETSRTPCATRPTSQRSRRTKGTRLLQKPGT